MIVRIANREDPQIRLLLQKQADLGLPCFSKLFCNFRTLILNTFPFLFSDKMLVIRAEIHKMIARIANREDPDQTASSEAG